MKKPITVTLKPSKKATVASQVMQFSSEATPVKLTTPQKSKMRKELT